MSDPGKKPEPPDDSRLMVTMSIAELRALVRAEIQASKRQELPRLLYSTGDAAKILGVPPTWLAAKARAGEVRVTRKGHYVLFSLADLQEFAARSDGVDIPKT